MLAYTATAVRGAIAAVVFSTMIFMRISGCGGGVARVGGVFGIAIGISVYDAAFDVSGRVAKMC